MAGCVPGEGGGSKSLTGVCLQGTAEVPLHCDIARGGWDSSMGLYASVVDCHLRLLVERFKRVTSICDLVIKGLALVQLTLPGMFRTQPVEYM